MAFPQEIINNAWRRAGGRCECIMNCHSSYNRCNKVLDPQNKAFGKTWEAHHKVSQLAGGSDGLENCMILCTECHENTVSYGRN